MNHRPAPGSLAERHEAMDRKAGTDPTRWFDLLIHATIDRDQSARAYAAGRLARLGYHVSYAPPTPGTPNRNPRLPFGDLVQARAACSRLGIKAALLSLRQAGWHVLMVEPRSLERESTNES